MSEKLPHEDDHEETPRPSSSPVPVVAEVLANNEPVSGDDHPIHDDDNDDDHDHNEASNNNNNATSLRARKWITRIATLLGFISVVLSFVSMSTEGSCCWPSSCRVSALPSSTYDKVSASASHYFKAGTDGICAAASSDTDALDFGESCKFTWKNVQTMTSTCKLGDRHAKGTVDSGATKTWGNDDRARCGSEATPKLGAVVACSSFLSFLVVFFGLQGFCVKAAEGEEDGSDRLTLDCLTIVGKVGKVVSLGCLPGAAISSIIGLANFAGTRVPSLWQRTMADSTTGASTNKPAAAATWGNGCGAASNDAIDRVAWARKDLILASMSLALLACVLYSLVMLKEHLEQKKKLKRNGGGTFQQLPSEFE